MAGFLGIGAVTPDEETGDTWFVLDAAGVVCSVDSEASLVDALEDIKGALLVAAAPHFHA